MLVHDGARPLVDDQTIENVLSSVRKYGSGVAATPVTDTIKPVSYTHLDVYKRQKLTS